MSKFGLLGKNIGYSFSKSFFTKKFEKENLPHSYENFDIPNLDRFPRVFLQNKELQGLNVTIPYKEEVIPLLDDLEEKAAQIGAVNTIKRLDNGTLKGYNTDYWGFQKALEEYLPLPKKTALILGTGGASKAVAFALDNLGFKYKFVSRTKSTTYLSYPELNKAIFQKYLLIVNCTPLGTFPNIEDFPPIPYKYLSENHLLFDLIYNPAETVFLQKGRLQGARISNGLKMLELQAEKAWEIWNS